MTQEQLEQFAKQLNPFRKTREQLWQEEIKRRFGHIKIVVTRDFIDRLKANQ